MTLGLYRLRKRLWAYKAVAHKIARRESIEHRAYTKVNWRAVAQADFKGRAFPASRLPV